MKPEITSRARRDLLVVLGASHERFGAEAAHRYRRLINQAIRDAAENPTRAGVVAYSASENIFLYHSRHARARTAAPTVRRARHVVVFRVVGARVMILHILHDAMDLSARLQDL